MKNVEAVARKAPRGMEKLRRNLGNVRRPLSPQGRPADRGQGGERRYPAVSILLGIFPRKIGVSRGRWGVGSAVLFLRLSHSFDRWPRIPFETECRRGGGGMEWIAFGASYRRPTYVKDNVLSFEREHTSSVITALWYCALV